MRERTGRRTTVLIVERAVSFGGSIVSTAALVRAVDPSAFRFVVVTAADRALLERRVEPGRCDVEIIQARPVMHYLRVARLKELGYGISNRWARKAFLLAAYLFEWAANLPWSLRVLWIIASRRAAIVQFNNGFEDDQLTLLTRLLGRRPIVFLRGYVEVGRFVRMLLLPHVRACVAVSQYVKNLAVDDGIPEEIITVATPPAIPVPVPPGASAEIRSRYGLDIDAPVVGIFGRIVEWKGQREFLEAAAIALRQVPEAAVLVVGNISDGDEDYEKEVRQRARDLGIADRVVFTGYVDDVDAHYRAVDVVAHASIKPEPSGRVVFEAMSNDVPLIVSSLGGPPEFVDDGVDGFVVNPKDIQLFARRLVDLLRDPGLRQRMTALAGEKLRTRYTSEAYGALVATAYRRCLDSPASGWLAS